MLLSIIAVGMSGGMAYVMSGVFGNDAAFQEQVVRDMERANNKGRAGGAREDSALPPQKEKEDESIPPWERGKDK